MVPRLALSLLLALAPVQPRIWVRVPVHLVFEMEPVGWTLRLQVQVVMRLDLVPYSSHLADLPVGQ